MPCALCHARKEKRFCPAVHDRICPPCCGTEREVTLDCPSACPYLQQARQHARERRPEEIAAGGGELFPQVELGRKFVYEREPLIAGLSAGLARASRDLRDRDLISALTAMAHTYQRLTESGLQYEEPVAAPAQQALAAELHRLIAEYRDLERQHLGTVTLRDLDVLRTLVFLVRVAHTHSTGRPLSRGFVDFLTAQFPEKKSPLDAPAGEPSRIIVP